MADNFDVVVIGAGPGGYVAAIRAAQLGLKTAIVEKQHLGGVCLNWGCIPTKALLRTSEIYHTMHRLEEFGLKADNLSFDIEKIIKRSRNVASQLSSGINGLLKKNKVQIIEGTAFIKNKTTIEVSKDKNTQQINAKNIIIATGARARNLPGFEADGEQIWTYKEAMTPKTMPKSLVIVGSGAIGVEFASFYNALGAEVTIIENQERILPVEDEEISKLAKKSFEKQNIKIITGAKVTKADKGKNVKVSYELKGKTQTIEAEKLIMAVGVVPNTENLGLEALNIKLEKGSIVTNDMLQTNINNIFAIGDVASAPWLAHKASHEAIIAVEFIAGKKPKALNKLNIPGCTYSHPQIASIGLTEQQAKEQKLDVKIGRFPFIANGKAVAMGDTEGLVKTIFDKKTGELLGAHMIGAEVTEMIQGYAIAKTLETTEQELMHTIFPHPTMSEMMHESVLDAFDKVIHF